MFHLVYIEITNICQFACSFCPQTKRQPGFMTPQQFEEIITKIKGHTKQIYLHVMGEPLLHPQLDEILTIANDHGLTVNLTTNGYELKNKKAVLLRHHHIKKINISLHSMEDNGQTSKDVSSYLRDVVSFADQAIKLIPATIVYRLWNVDTESTMMMQFLQSQYEPDFAIDHAVSPQNGHRLAYRVFLHQANRFEWPVQAEQKEKSLDTSSVGSNGYCLGLKSHIAVLVNGDVVPCCLDSEGKLVLGNLLQQSLEDILLSERAVKMRIGFQRHQAVEPMCQHCSYKDRFGTD